MYDYKALGSDFHPVYSIFINENSIFIYQKIFVISGRNIGEANSNFSF